MGKAQQTVSGLVLLVLWIGAVSCGPKSGSKADGTAHPMIGKMAPDFVLQDAAGKDVKLSDFKGKVVLLNFWATWCPPCRKEIPDFIALQKAYQGKGLAIIGVSLDQPGMAAVKPFAEKMGMNYPVVVGDAKLTEAYGGIEYIPTTFLIARNGQILRGFTGYHERGVFEKAIKEALE